MARLPNGTVPYHDDPTFERRPAPKKNTILPQSISETEGIKRNHRGTMTLAGVISMFGSIKDVIKEGGFFGEIALFSNVPRTATIITKKECELLCIARKDFAFVSENYDRRRMKLLNFMSDVFPEVENVNT